MGADVHEWNDWALCWSAENGYLDVVTYLRQVVGDKWKCHNCLVRMTCLNFCEDYKN